MLSESWDLLADRQLQEDLCEQIGKMLPSPFTQSKEDIEGKEEKEAQEVRMQYERLAEERDEAERQLKHIKRVSQMVIEEVSALQTQLEIEKSCRENAEALATKLNQENRKLKYLSLSSRPCLDELLPSISDCIALEEEPQDPSPDPYIQYQHQVKDLQETINVLLEEKKQLSSQVQDLQNNIEELTAKLGTEQKRVEELEKTIENQTKTIKKYNRVSLMAAEEYEELRAQLELEENLRQKAEAFAHEMLIKQKEANRQSMILLQQVDPSVRLLKALEEVANITKTLEEERIRHQQKVQELELQLNESVLCKEVISLQKQLDFIEEEKRGLEQRVQQAEQKNTEMKYQVNELKEKLTKAESVPEAAPPPPPPPHPPPPPPPLPPPPPPPPPSRCNPLSSLIAIMRKSSKSSKGIPKSEPSTPAQAPVDDVKVKAVNEMMERIKHGVVLRPVTQDKKVKIDAVLS
nr:PREDICTED: shootin-1-like [Latimeria chalumnae]|eukprot:XP_014348601.1 PREDICTED: shootin-1-like [Latimeria chalumnae]